MTIKSISVDSYNSCTWRLTPWDARALGVNTADIKDIVYGDRLADLLDQVEQVNRANRIDLSYFRYSANDLNVKREALRHGFNLTEFSVFARHNDIGKIVGPTMRFQFLPVLPDDENRLAQIREIATETFKHGRFHEDPLVDPLLAQRRYYLWIDDIAKNARLFAWEMKGKVAGFFSYQVEDGILDLPLSGLAPAAQRMGGFFWTAMFSFIHETEQVKRTSILISGANTAVINLYSYLGFSLDDPMFGYHKHYTPEAP